jgi:hypothetical protein
MPGVASGTVGKVTRTWKHGWLHRPSATPARRVDPLARLREFHSGRLHGAHVLQAVLRDARRDAQAARLVNREQRRTGHGHVAHFSMAAGDNAGDRCQDGGVALAGAGGSAIGGRGIEIRLALSRAQRHS